MIDHSTYLTQPAKPCPLYLPGDLVISARGIFWCRGVRWVGAAWAYRLVPA